MCLYDKSAVRPYRVKIIVRLPRKLIGMCPQPILTDAVDAEICPAAGVFKAEEYVHIPVCGDLLCFMIGKHDVRYDLIPRQSLSIPQGAAAAVEKMVGQANPGVSEIPIEGELFLHRPIGATASLGGVQMHFIAILSFFHSSPVFFLEKDYRSSI